MKTEREELESWLEDSGALQRGHFALSSGRHATAYVQCALLLQDGRRARRLGGRLADRLAADAPHSVLSPALGGLIIGHEVAAALGVPFRFTERRGAAMELRRGFELRRGERIVVVEDVITTGRSSREAAAVAEGLGATLVAVAAIIDRTSDGNPFGVPLRSLLRLELPSFALGECPACRRGEPTQKPGSRPGDGL